MSVFKLLRIVILLSVLFVLMIGAWMTERRLAGWDKPLWVTIYPIAATADDATMNYARSVTEANFQAINDFLKRELGLYTVTLTPPVQFQIAPFGQELPPTMPEDRLDTVAVALWSLKMRWWAWRKGRKDGLVAPDIQMFVLYHKLGGQSEISISVGMRKGMYGLVKAYAGNQHSARNQVIRAHELMHVLGASDKYTFATGDPIFPEGYAEPNKRPLFPQVTAEIMGGRIALTAYESVMPESLEQCRIGHRTAEEIGLFSRLVDH